MKNLAIEILKKETEYEDRIKKLEEENEFLKQRVDNAWNEALSIRLCDDGRYCSLTDFCRITKNLLFIKETELKQWLCQQHYIEKINDKYSPVEGQDICLQIDGDIFVKYEFIRSKILFLRTLIYINDEVAVKEFVKTFDTNKDALIEQMANTVYVSYKQNSNEFKYHKDNKYFSAEIDSMNKVG